MGELFWGSSLQIGKKEEVVVEWYLDGECPDSKTARQEDSRTARCEDSEVLRCVDSKV